MIALPLDKSPDHKLMRRNMFLGWAGISVLELQEQEDTLSQS